MVFRPFSKKKEERKKAQEVEAPAVKPVFEDEYFEIIDTLKLDDPEETGRAMVLYVEILEKWKPAIPFFDHSYFVKLSELLKGDIKYFKYITTKGLVMFGGEHSHQNILAYMEKKGIPANKSQILDGGNISLREIDVQTGVITLCMDAGSTIVGTNKKANAKKIVDTLKKKIPPAIREIIQYEYLTGAGAAKRVEGVS